MNKPLDTAALASLTGKRILITGGAGYLASSLVSLLKDVDCHIIRLGQSAERFTPIAGSARTEDVVGDVRDRDTWESTMRGVDVVFHFAAQTSVYVADKDAVTDLNANVVPMLHLLEECRQKSIHPTILFSGTVTEAGMPARLPVDETHPDHPITIYDLHKLMAENYLKYYVAQGLVRGASLRLSNIFGPGPKSSSADRGVLNLMIRRALAGEPITIYGQGEYVRDYVYVTDVARAFVLAAAAIENTNGRHFVIGSGKGHTIAEAMRLVSRRVARKTGLEVPLVHIEPPQPQSPIEARSFVADTSLFTELTGWRPIVSLSEGIDRTIESNA